MTDLDTLRPEVADAVSALDETTCMTNPGLKWYATIRAELLRLARENDEWQMRCLQFQTERDHARQMHADRDVDVQHEWARAEKAEAELAALKARIAEAPVGVVNVDDRGCEFVSVDFAENTRVRLVVEK